MALARYPNLRRNGGMAQDPRLSDDIVSPAALRRYRNQPSPFDQVPVPRHGGGRLAPTAFDPMYGAIARIPPDPRMQMTLHSHSHSHSHNPYDSQLQQHQHSLYYSPPPSLIRDPFYHPPSHPRHHPRRCHHHPWDDPHHCGCNTPSSSGGCRSGTSNPNSNTKKEFDFKTKEIVIRGKVYSVRTSFLTDSGKFEADIQKYMEKKKVEEVPDRIVEMLISFVNREEYRNNSLSDEVVLNILASNVGVKSVVKHSLERLKSMSRGDVDVPLKELGELLVTVMCSGKVDSGLQEWFGGWLKEERRYERFFDERGGVWGEREIDRVCDCHPEAVIAVETLLGVRGKELKDPYVVL